MFILLRKTEVSSQMKPKRNMLGHTVALRVKPEDCAAGLYAQTDSEDSLTIKRQPQEVILRLLTLLRLECYSSSASMPLMHIMRSPL